MQELVMIWKRGLFSAVSVLLYAAPGLAQTADAPVMPVAPPVFPTGTTTQLGEQIAALLSDPSVSRAHWGIAVTAMDGTPIYGLDEGKLFRPASNAKLFTTAAAMALLGPDATVETKIVGQMDVRGTVKGDLTIVGAGDANLASDDLPYVEPALRPKGVATQKPVGLDDLRALADQLVAKGVKRVTGRIVGDDTAFVYEPFAESWDVGDLVWGYGAPVSALTIADNELKLTVAPGTVSGPKGSERYGAPTVTLEQNGVPYYTVDAQVYTEPPGTGSHVNVERLPGSRVLRVYGSMGADAQPDVEHVSIDDPALYTAMALKQMLVERGIEVSGEAAVEHQEVRGGRGFLSAVDAPLTQCEADLAGGSVKHACGCPTDARAPSRPVLASHISAPLAEDVTLTLKVSQNLHAEMLLHRLGQLPTCDLGTTAGGAKMRRAFLLHAGLDPADFVFYDGSGLSGHDLVTPRATAQLLAYAAKQPWFAQWKAALPVGGEDGTLTSRFADAPLKDHLFAKTGTLGESRALSGYVDTASGKQVIFSIFVDDHSPAGSNDRKVMDEIVAAIAAAE